MSGLTKLLEEVRLRPADTSKQTLGPRAETRAREPVATVTSISEAASAPALRSPSQDWDALIRRVQSTARRSREMQTQAREQEARIEKVLQEVREDINAANERMRAAEAGAREVQSHAEARILAAEERVKAAEARARVAEERAQHAEGWLERVQETILSEFTDPKKQAAA